MSTCINIRIYNYLHVLSYLWLSMYIIIYTESSIYLSICLSVCLSVRRSVCASVCRRYACMHTCMDAGMYACMLCYVVLWYVMLCCVMLCYVMYGMVWYGTVWYGTATGMVWLYMCVLVYTSVCRLTECTLPGGGKISSGIFGFWNPLRPNKTIPAWFVCGMITSQSA